MLIVETIGKIRRAFFRQGKSIKAICRELRVSRKVVRKVIRSKVRLGEGPSQEPGWADPRAVLHTAAAVQDL